MYPAPVCLFSSQTENSCTIVIVCKTVSFLYYILSRKRLVHFEKKNQLCHSVVFLAPRITLFERTFRFALHIICLRFGSEDGGRDALIYVYFLMFKKFIRKKINKKKT